MITYPLPLRLVLVAEFMEYILGDFGEGEGDITILSTSFGGSGGDGGNGGATLGRYSGGTGERCMGGGGGGSGRSLY